jgi:hypothetical protein
MLNGYRGPLREQLRGEPLPLRDALDFESNRFYRLFDALESRCHGGRNLWGPLIDLARVRASERSENRNGTSDYEGHDRDESADYRWMEGFHVSE